MFAETLAQHNIIHMHFPVSQTKLLFPFIAEMCFCSRAVSINWTPGWHWYLTHCFWNFTKATVCCYLLEKSILSKTGLHPAVFTKRTEGFAVNCPLLTCCDPKGNTMVSCFCFPCSIILNYFFYSAYCPMTPHKSLVLKCTGSSWGFVDFIDSSTSN